MITAIRPEEQVIDIGEGFAQHPRTPGPRLMRAVDCLPVVIETERMTAALEAQAEAHCLAMKRVWDREWAEMARVLSIKANRVRAKDRYRETRQTAFAAD